MAGEAEYDAVVKTVGELMGMSVAHDLGWVCRQYTSHVTFFCGGEVLVIGPHLLGDNAQGYLQLELGEDEGQEEVLEDKDEEEEESEVDEKVKEVRENAQLMHATW